MIVSLQIFLDKVVNKKGYEIVSVTQKNGYMVIYKVNQVIY